MEPAEWQVWQLCEQVVTVLTSYAPTEMQDHRTFPFVLGTRMRPLVLITGAPGKFAGQDGLSCDASSLLPTTVYRHATRLP